MNATTILALFFAVLLGVEWRYRPGWLRLGAALFALAVLFFAQPGYTRAARRALSMPPSERITQGFDGRPLSDYVSGVRTMERAVVDDVEMGADARLLAIGVLFWLACTPVVRGAPSSIRERSGRMPAPGGDREREGEAARRA